MVLYCVYFYNLANNKHVAAATANAQATAVVFFAGIIATKWMGGQTIGIGVMGTLILLFLIVAIGRNLRSKR